MYRVFHNHKLLAEYDPNKFSMTEDGAGGVSVFEIKTGKLAASHKVGTFHAAGTVFCGYQDIDGDLNCKVCHP